MIKIDDRDSHLGIARKRLYEVSNALQKYNR